MNGPPTGVLIVRAGALRLALRLADVLEVGDTRPAQLVPKSLPALRGLTIVRDRLVPLVHLESLLWGIEAPPEPGVTMICVRIAGRWVALEVDDADAAPDQEILQAPQGLAADWATGAVCRADGWVPLLNPDALADRFHGVEVET